MKGYRVLFGPSPPGMVGGGEVIGFAGPGEPMPRRRLTRTERRVKRRKAKLRRTDLKANRKQACQ